MADKNFIMKQKTSGGYDTLYPQTIDEQVKLSASISSLFGGTDVNDALAVLGKYNQYCWKRSVVGANNWTYVYSTNRNQYPDDGIAEFTIKRAKTKPAVVILKPHSIPGLTFTVKFGNEDKTCDMKKPRRPLH